MADTRQTHEEVRDLLPRFIEIERRDGNAAEIYPEVAAHIAECDDCRFAVSIVLTDLPGFDPPPDSTLRAADLPFMRHPAQSSHTIRPGSRHDNYSIHISFPLLLNREWEGDTARSDLRTVLDVPVGGLLLGVHSLTFDRSEIGVMLTLYRKTVDPDRDTFFIVADLVGDFISDDDSALLLIGSRKYMTPIVRHAAEFWDVELGDDPQQIVLILES